MNLTRKQREALKAVFDRTAMYLLDDSPTLRSGRQDWPDYQNFRGVTYREYRRMVRLGSGCIMVPWIGIWLGIEPDGYTHS